MDTNFTVFGEMASICEECGSVILSTHTDKHRRWHEDLDDRLNPREGV